MKRKSVAAAVRASQTNKASLCMSGRWPKNHRFKREETSWQRILASKFQIDEACGSEEG